MKVKILKIDPNAVIPEKAHKTDYCYDVYAVSEEEIKIAPPPTPEPTPEPSPTSEGATTPDGEKPQEGGDTNPGEGTDPKPEPEPEPKPEPDYPTIWKYGLGFALQLQRDNEIIEMDKAYIEIPTIRNETVNLKNSPLTLSIDFRPRSSVYKTGMMLCNCTGTIDEGYTGEISAYFYHVVKNLPRYKVGDKIGQIKIGLSIPMEFEEVTELKPMDRGENGFGSSGK